MWNRIRLIFRSLFGWMLRGVEDPELILRQHMDDLRSKLPELNRQVAEIVKLEKMLQMQFDRLQAKVTDLESKVVAAVKMGDQHKEAAKTLIAGLETSKTELTDTAAQLEQAKGNSVRAIQARDSYEKRIKQQINEAMRQISRAKRAKMEEEMASLMMSFETGDETDTMQRMTEKIDERLARAQARTEVAGSTLEMQIQDVEAAALEQSAEDKYVEYQRQLGLIPDEPAAERTMLPVTETSTQSEPPTVQTETQTEEN